MLRPTTRLAGRLAARLGAAAAALAVAAGAAAAQPVLIDFAEYRSPVTTAYQATLGGDVYTKGFVFTSSSNALGTYGTDDPADPFAPSVPSNLGPTAAALWTDQFGTFVDMRVWRDPASDDNSAGGKFDLYSIDVAHLYASSYLTTPPGGATASLAPFNFVMFGWTSDDGFGSSAVGQFFTIPVPPRVGGVQTPVLTTIQLSSAWSGLSRVRFYNGSYNTATGAIDAGSAISSQFTNIVAEVVPEPSTYLLVAAGVLMLVVVSRRRASAHA